LRHEIRPSIALAFLYLQKFSPDLLAVFDHVVNYHNGLLPQYRGVKTTAWSVYHGESSTGFTFHYMNHEFDQGPILIQGSVPIHPDSNPLDLELQKARLAAAHLPQVLRMLTEQVPGEGQCGQARYFSWPDYLAVTKVSAPCDLSYAELQKRIRAFGFLRMKIDQRWHAISQIRPISTDRSLSGRYCFRTAEGILVEATRLRYFLFRLLRLPAWFWKRFAGKPDP
jgi:UDP-4-amino-4-deoxy-L-arabinose formyltransferase/UDP-glucuronic acid dehydrogenase (UDP-4-keto-hexauronic acid decarboxylating)